MKKDYIKYILFAVLIVLVFFGGRATKKDSNMAVWEAERDRMLTEQESKRDSLNLKIEAQTVEIILLEEKDSVNIETIITLSEDVQKEKEKQVVVEEKIDKLDNIELKNLMILEYEKYNN